MILVRSPLRITLGGGGTDLPAYASQYGGFCLTAAIDQYVYVSAMRPFLPGIYLKYSEQEHVAEIAAVQHPIIRAALRRASVERVELVTLADIPAGTGLGSSSSFTTALVTALSLYQHRQTLTADRLAALACDIEIGDLQAPIGTQDQYAVAYGGIRSLTTQPDGTVSSDALPVSEATCAALEDGLLLFFTGFTRAANSMVTGHAPEAMHRIKQLGYQAADYLTAGDLPAFGQLLDAHWMDKRTLVPGMTSPIIDRWYALAKQHGAMGGKLVGAGGGGFLMFYTESPHTLRHGLAGSGLQEVRFRFDWEGTKVLLT